MLRNIIPYLAFLQLIFLVDLLFTKDNFTSLSVIKRLTNILELDFIQVVLRSLKNPIKVL